jgi:putative SOS response-associated peptidase YedK
MPVFMPLDRWNAWLNPRNTDVNELKSLMVVEKPESIVKAYPVSSAVNSVANNGKGLIVEVPLGEPETLF